MTEFVSIQNENTLCKTSLFFSTNNFEGGIIGRKKNKTKQENKYRYPFWYISWFIKFDCHLSHIILDVLL